MAGLFAPVRDPDMRRTSALITELTLVIAGKFDTVTSHAMDEAIARTVPGAHLKTLQRASDRHRVRDGIRE